MTIGEEAGGGRRQEGGGRRACARELPSPAVRSCCGTPGRSVFPISATMVIHDYRVAQLQKRNRHGVFRGNRVKSSHVVGMGVETASQPCYRPAPGVPPVCLGVMKATNIEHVKLPDVLAPGNSRPSTVAVFAEEPDAKLSISILKKVLGKLMGSPYYLEVATCTHATSGGLKHDLIMQPHLLFGGMPPGLYSIEIKCREVKVLQPSTHSWREEAEAAARSGWDAELAAHPGAYAARIVVFVQMASPCHSGGVALHASILRAGQERFTKLWGWAGFDSPGGPAGEASSPSDGGGAQHVAAVASAGPFRRAAQASAAAQLSPAAQWRGLLGQLPDVGGWVPLPAFLRMPQVGRAKTANHCVRFLDGSRKDAWKSATGHNPVKGRDWDHKKTRAGGGAGDGTVHCTKAFLKFVFLKYYAKGG